MVSGVVLILVVTTLVEAGLFGFGMDHFNGLEAK
jgi:hypothetical protein